MPPCTALLDNPAKAGMLRSSRFTAPAAPILVAAVVSGSRWRRTWQARGRCEEQVVPVEFCPGG